VSILFKVAKKKKDKIEKGRSFSDPHIPLNRDERERNRNTQLKGIGAGTLIGSALGYGAGHLASKGLENNEDKTLAKAVGTIAGSSTGANVGLIGGAIKSNRNLARKRMLEKRRGVDRSKEEEKIKKYRGY
jgi:hypothetical protein